jgi:GrpB-like predicted nucleotidyltransferase (UPF0157 family)
VDGVVEYDKRWVEWFGEIRAALPGQLLVEHVGSTAIPGLAAKPIVDVDVVVASESEVAATIVAITECGWRHQGNLGIQDREAFTGRFDLPPHHLYVVLAGSRPHLDHIDLRDHLRDNAIDAAHYGDLKRRLAPLLAEDRQAYLAAKSELIADLLATARTQTP